MAEGSGSPYDLRFVRRACVQAVGKETVLKLHRQSVAADLLGLVLLYGAFGALVYLLGTLPFGVPFVLCLLLQGFVIMAFGYFMHDVCIHRRFGGKRFSYWLGVVSALLSTQRRTNYAFIHYDHHFFTGTDEDEDYKQDLTTRGRRWFFLTAIGQVLAFKGRLKVKRPPEFPAPAGTFSDHPFTKEAKRHRKRERWIRYAFRIGLVVGLFLWPRFVGFGYLLPLLLVLPVANGLRILLEHSETNPENPFHCATFYRTGFLTRPLFFWDAGDCHLVHHIFPNIPWYRMGRAVDTMRPFLLEQGVRERRSLPKLFYGFFVRNEPHRALWSA